MDRRKKIAAAAGLPDELLQEILSRATAKELHRSRCVSEGWRDLIADPIHRKKLSQTLHGFFPSYPGESFIEAKRSFIKLLGETPLPFDPSLSCLNKLRKIFWLWGSYGGLLLFSHDLGYVVFNPATGQWAAVHTPRDGHFGLKHAFLVFDPAVSSSFQLVIFCEVSFFKEERMVRMCIVHSYSSKTGVWRRSQIDWAKEVRKLGQLNIWVPQITGDVSHATVFNGMLYLILTDDQIAVVDVEGKVQRIFPGPPSVDRKNSWHHSLFIGQSQGRLHYITEERWARNIPSELSNTRDVDDEHDLLSVWVLEDYGTHKWVLKHSVSQARLFGSNFYRSCKHDYRVVAIHPDSNLLFIFLSWKRELISYGLDSKEVRAVGATQDAIWFTPYVPCFSDFTSVDEHEEHQGHLQAGERLVIT